MSEIVAYDVTDMGARPASKGDPLNLTGTIYQTATGGWTASQSSAAKDEAGQPLKYPDSKGKRTGQLAILGLGQNTPSLVDQDTNKQRPGGYCAREIAQTAVLSLAALQRLRFPLKPGTPNDEKLNDTGRAVIAALGLYALSASHAEGFWLRSRCELVAAGPAEIEIVRADGVVEKATLPKPSKAAQLLEAAGNAAKKLGLNWRTKPIVAKPNLEFAALIRQQGVV